MSRNYDILTPRQTACLGTINALTRLDKPPTLAEIGHSLNVKKASAQSLVGTLVRKGYLRRQAGAHRSTQLTPKALAALGEKTPTLTT